VATDKAHETGLAGRYATALFDLATEHKAIDAVSADLGAFRRAVALAEDEFRAEIGPEVATVVALGLEAYAQGWR